MRNHQSETIYRSSPVVIAIDGPAGSGKSTVAKAVAAGIGFCYLDTGALYRAVAWLACRIHRSHGNGVDETAVVRSWDPELIDQMGLHLTAVDNTWRPSWKGEIIERDELRSSRVTEIVPRVAALKGVREWVGREVRSSVDVDAVVEGRDIGTAVFPRAFLKVYLTATAKERARRRLSEESDDVTRERLKRTARRIRARDEADAGRSLDPLRRADDAVEIDTTDLAPDEVVDRILEEARDRGLDGS